MTDDSLTRIGEILDRFDGLAPLELAGELQEEFGFTRVRSKLIARDQVLKLNAAVTTDAHKQAGIDRYRWSTSKDGSVRDRHADLEGQIFSYDDPPVVNEQGDVGNPGEDYQCRCVPIPVLDELEETG